MAPVSGTTIIEMRLFFSLIAFAQGTRILANCWKNLYKINLPDRYYISIIIIRSSSSYVRVLLIVFTSLTLVVLFVFIYLSF